MTQITVAANGGAERPLGDWCSDITLAQQIAAAAETTAVDAKFMAEALNTSTSALVWGTKRWTPGSAADQSSGVQEAVNAAQGKWLIAPSGDTYAKGIVWPNLGIKMRGAGMAYSWPGAGTRFLLPANANTFAFATQSYVNNNSWANYGPDLDDFCIDGNKTQQQTPVPLVILRATGSKLGERFLVENGLGIGVRLTNVASNGSVLAAALGTHFIDSRISKCDEEGFHAQNGAGGGLADIFMRRTHVMHCGGGPVKKWSVLIDRGAGLEADTLRVYGKGCGSLRVDGFGLAKVVNGHFYATDLVPVDGVVENVRINASGAAIGGYRGNMHWNWKAASGGAVWKHLVINGQTIDARITAALNDYHSQFFDMIGWEKIGLGQVSYTPGSYFRCSAPA